MSQHGAGLHARDRPADHVKISAADGAGRQAHDCVRRLLDFGIGNIIQANITDSVKDDCFHYFSSLLPQALPTWLALGPESKGQTSPCGSIASLPVLLLHCGLSEF